MASFFSRVSDFVNGRGASDDEPLHDQGAQHLFAIKAQLLAQVREAAGAERPTIEQYRQASVAFAATDEGKALVAEGKWSDRIAADLSGQNLDRFAFSEPKKAKAVKTYDLHDRDGNGQIDVEATHAFYDNVTLDNASLNHAFIEPATSFNDQIAKAKHLDGLEFNGMEGDEHFHFRSGHYTNIAMSNVNGGAVIFDHGSSVDGLKLSGKSAEIVAQPHSRIAHLEINDQFRVVKLELGKGTHLTDANLEGATISMASHVEGSHWSRVKLGSNIDGLNLNGAKLHDVTIDGEAIKSVAQLQAHGVIVDAHTQVSTSPDFLRQHQMAQMQAQMGDVIEKLNGALHAIAPHATAQKSGAMNSLTLAGLGKSISGGHEASLAQVEHDGASAARELPVTEKVLAQKAAANEAFAALPPRSLTRH